MSSFKSSSPLVAFSSVKTTPSEWHSILGHLASSVFKYVVSNFSLPLSSLLSIISSYNACESNKSYKFPFSTSTIVSSHLLEVIFSDVWTSPIYSIEGFKYYVIFVDHFTKYI